MYSDSGADISGFKCHGDWKSSCVERYNEDTFAMKNKIAKMIEGSGVSLNNARKFENFILML